jgi:hypothetical protein
VCVCVYIYIIFVLFQVQASGGQCNQITGLSSVKICLKLCPYKDCYVTALWTCQLGNVRQELPEVASYQERINRTSHAAESGGMFS